MNANTNQGAETMEVYLTATRTIPAANTIQVPEVYLTATRTIPAANTIQVPEVFALAFIGLMCVGAVVALWWAVERDRAIRPNRRKAR